MIWRVGSRIWIRCHQTPPLQEHHPTIITARTLAQPPQELHPTTTTATITHPQPNFQPHGVVLRKWVLWGWVYGLYWQGKDGFRGEKEMSLWVLREEEREERFGGGGGPVSRWEEERRQWKKKWRKLRFDCVW